MAFGADVGTYTLVCCKRDEDNNFVKECMETEAVECLMKPIGFKAIKHLKNLEKYLKMQQAED